MVFLRKYQMGAAEDSPAFLTDSGQRIKPILPTCIKQSKMRPRIGKQCVCYESESMLVIHVDIWVLGL